MAGNYFKNRLSIAQSAVFVNYLSGRMAECLSTAVGYMTKFQYNNILTFII